MDTGSSAGSGASVGPAGPSGPAGLQVIVVDNNPEGPDGPVPGIVAAQPIPGAIGGTARYVHEPAAGVAAVRNAALREALPDGYLVFIDDDCLPLKGWLAEMLACAARTRATAVVGLAKAVLGEEAEAWVHASGHFTAVHHEVDQVLEGGGSTANLLLDLHQLRIAGIRFDLAYGTTGGEDSRLLRDVRLAGGRVVACPTAVTTEPVPQDRATREWVLARTQRNAETWSRVRVDLRPGEGVRVPLLNRACLVGRGAFLTARGRVTLAVAAARKDAGARARAERAIASGRGVVLGALGYNREEYARPAG
jgi:hypothetical protein